MPLPLRLLAALALLAAAPAARAQVTFAEVDAGIPPDSLDQGPEDEYYVATVAPADVDADGDFDLRLLATYLNLDLGVFRDALTLYRNEGPGAAPDTWRFTPEDAPVAPGETLTGDLAWGDYDNDNDVDVVVATATATVLYRNDDGVLVPTGVALPLYDESAQLTPAPFDRRSISWADYDNDGDLDLLLPSVFEDAGDYATVLLRNDGEGGPFGWTFTRVEVGLPPTLDAQSAWGDVDNDGDLDLLLQDNDTFDGPGSVQVFRNDGGAFVADGPPLESGLFGAADWGDYDNDGDLDVLVAGRVAAGPVVRIHRQDAAGYTLVPVVNPSGSGSWADVQTASWADYDADGDVDILATGRPQFSSQGESVLFLNAAGVFTRLPVWTLPAPYDFEGGGGTLASFDLDADGDLDHFTHSRYYAFPDAEIPQSETRVFRTDVAGVNAGPTAPAGLTAAVVGADVTLSWAPASDDHTPAAGLTYNLWVLRPGSDIVSPMSHPNTGTRLIPEAGNVSHNGTWTLRNLPAGTYTWTVQAVDNAFNGGPFAPQVTFTVNPVAAEPGAVAPALDVAVAPAPARGRSAVTLALPEAATATVAVFDALGRRVAVLHEGPLAAGTHAFALDAGRLAPGAYVVRATAGGAVRARPFVVAR